MRNKRTKGKIMSLVMAFAMSLSVLGGVTASTLQVKAAATVSNPRIAEDGTVTWDKITFGSYPQDLKEITTEKIKWRILDINGDDAFLIADEALDCKEYNTNIYSCAWETCTLREWLNGTGTYASDDTAFIKVAFSNDERNAIIQTTVKNEGGNDTTDSIYLLSIGEASNPDYGFDVTFDEECKTRQAKATVYAAVNGAYYNGSYNDGKCNWWLRSSSSSSYVAYVSGEGFGVYDDYEFFDGEEFYDDYLAVRPVLHVNMSSSYVTDAGTVNSEGNVTEGSNIKKTSDKYKEPSINSEGVVTWDCVYFGSYKQKAIFDKKSIEWRVLSVSGNDAFVVADKALDRRAYNDKGKEKTSDYGYNYTDYSCTWETCTLRDWLNGTGSFTSDDTAFISAAFSNDERNAIIPKMVKNYDNSQYESEGSNDTTDSVYLLSIGEIINADYGFSAENTPTNYKAEFAEKCKPTDYAILKGSSFGNKFESNSGSFCYWWLRSSATSNDQALCAPARKKADRLSFNWYVHENTAVSPAVRPALHVNLSSSYVKYAGSVSSNGNSVTVDEIEVQKKADEVIALISAIGTVTKDSKTAIDTARSAYEALSETGKAKVTNYGVLQEAESKYAELTKSGSGKDNDNGKENKGNGGNTDNASDGSTGSNTGTTPATTETVNTPTITETPKDALTTFNIKNKKTYKKSQKVTIKDKDGIKSVVLNKKKIKVKKGKKTVSFKLSSYKKSLKKKNKWNKIIVIDVNGNKKTIQFKTK